MFDAHSADDEWVDVDDGREVRWKPLCPHCFNALTRMVQLYDAAVGVPASCKTFVEVSGALHDDPMTQQEKDALTAWVNARR